MIILKKIGNFFVKIWQWFKETAWIQVLLIVGVVIGVVVAIPPVVKGINSLVEQNKKVTFYKDNRITYDEYVEKVEGQTEGMFIVMLYSPTCSHCEAIQKSVRDFYKEYKDQTIYFIDIDDKDYITDAQIAVLKEQYAQVYDSQATEDKNENYSTFPDSMPTPTIAVIKDKSPYKISLGLSESRSGVFEDLLDLLELKA